MLQWTLNVKSSWVEEKLHLMLLKYVCWDLGTRRRVGLDFEKWRLVNGISFLHSQQISVFISCWLLFFSFSHYCNSFVLHFLAKTVRLYHLNCPVSCLTVNCLVSSLTSSSPFNISAQRTQLCFSQTIIVLESCGGCVKRECWPLLLKILIE